MKKSSSCLDGKPMDKAHRPIAIEAVDHAGAAVEDIAAAVDWWHTHFGFELELQFDVPDIGAKIAFIRFGNQRIEFINFPNTRRKDRDVFDSLGHAGLHHIALRVDDCARAVQDLRERGVEILAEPADSPTAVYAFLRDGSGNYVELIELKSSD